MLQFGLEIEINSNEKRGFSEIRISDESQFYDLWVLANKLQKAEFKIKKIIKDDYVFDYNPDKFDETDADNITTIILEYNYNDNSYICEINEDKFILRPIFPGEEHIKRKLYECIADPSSVYLQTAIENIQSAELNLSLGSIRSASSDIYYAVHNLLKSIKYSYNQDEAILLSDKHPPLFLINTRLSVIENDYDEKIKNNYHSELGKLESWIIEVSLACSKLEEIIRRKNYNDLINRFFERMQDITEKIIEYCENRTENEHPVYNFNRYLNDSKEKIHSLQDISGFAKFISVPLIATYEARVLGDYKFNFESLMSRNYISLLYWFVEEFINLTKLRSSNAYSRGLPQKISKVSELDIVANKKAHNSILVIVRFSGSTFNPFVLKNKIFEEWSNCLSIIEWEKDFPIKIQLLENEKPPITIEIYDGSQIDIYSPMNSERSTLDDQYKFIEDIVEKIYYIIVENCENALIKISPITLSHQHKIIKQKSAEMSRGFQYNRLIREKNILESLKSHIVNYSDSSPKSFNMNNTIAAINGVKVCFGLMEYIPSQIKQRYISDVIGSNFVKRSKLGCDKVLIFTCETSIKSLNEKDIILFESAYIIFCIISDLIWEELSHDIAEETKENLCHTFEEAIKNIIKS